MSEEEILSLFDLLTKETLPLPPPPSESIEAKSVKNNVTWHVWGGWVLAAFFGSLFIASLLAGVI